MAIIPISRTYPRSLAYEDRVRNGKVPDWRLVSGATARVLFGLTHCRKMVFQKAQDPGGIHAGASGTTTQWRWKFRTGEHNASGNTVKLWARAEVLPPSNSSATDPRWRIFAGGNNSSYRRFPAYVGSPTASDLRSQAVVLTGLTPNTEYDCGLEIEDYGKVVSLAVWEEVPIEADSAAAYVTGQYQTLGNGLEITDAQHTELAVDPFTIWKHNGAQYFSIVPDVVTGPWSTTSTSYVNMLDSASSTTVSASTAGVNIVAQYHAPIHTQNVACVFAVYAKASAGTASSVILANSGGTLGEVTGFNSGGEWKSVAVNLGGAAASNKLDVQFKDTGGNTLTVEAVCLYAYEA